MNREHYVEIRRHLLDNMLSAEDISEVLYDYCIDKGANGSQSNIINTCINAVLNNGAWRFYFRIAKEYFDVKFEIMELYSKEFEVMTPDGSCKQRKLLNIY